MAIPEAGHEIREFACNRVRVEALPRCLAAIDEVVASVRAHEPGALRREVRREHGDPTRFVHIFVDRDDAAQRRLSRTIHRRPP